jgi:hypothetical protein
VRATGEYQDLVVGLLRIAVDVQLGFHIREPNPLDQQVLG